jgi:hypothetical protein
MAGTVYSMEKELFTMRKAMVWFDYCLRAKSTCLRPLIKGDSEINTNT